MVEGILGGGRMEGGYVGFGEIVMMVDDGTTKKEQCHSL